MKKALFIGIALIASTTTFAQKKEAGNYTSDDLNMTIVRQDDGSFTELVCRGGGDVFIRQGAVSDVKFFGEQDELRKVQTTWKGNKLEISSMGANVRAEVTMPKINKVSISGSGDVVALNDWNVSDLNLAVAGSGDMKLNNISAQNLRVSVAGSGDIKTGAGSIDVLSVSVAGSGTVAMPDVKAKNATVRVAGSGDAFIGSTEALDASVSGSGDVTYKGNPTITKKVVGSGDIRKVE